MYNRKIITEAGDFLFLFLVYIHHPKIVKTVYTSWFKKYITGWCLACGGCVTGSSLVATENVYILSSLGLTAHVDPPSY